MVTFRDSPGFEDFLKASLVLQLSFYFSFLCRFLDSWSAWGWSWPLAMPFGNMRWGHASRSTCPGMRRWTVPSSLASSPSGPTSSSSTPSCPYRSMSGMPSLCPGVSPGSSGGPLADCSLLWRWNPREGTWGPLLPVLWTFYIICLSSWAKQTSLQFLGTLDCIRPKVMLIYIAHTYCMLTVQRSRLGAVARRCIRNGFPSLQELQSSRGS